MIQAVYISSPGSQELYVWKLNSEFGEFKLVQVVNTFGSGQPIVIHPNKRFLYVGIRPDFGISTYYIDRLSGYLTYQGTTKIFSSPTHLMCNAQGTFLYCSSYNYNNISVVPLDNLGKPESPIQVIENLLGCHCSNISRSNLDLLWVPCLLENSIRLFKIEGLSGTLTPWNVDRIVIDGKSGPRHMVFDNSGYYAYLMNEFSSTINVIQCSFKTQKFKVLQTLSMFPRDMNIKKFWGSDIHITPNERWLYCSDRANNLISCFSICDKNKQLTFNFSSFTEMQPRGFSIDFTGTFLIVAGQVSNCISLYSIHQNHGELIRLSRYFSGKEPIWVSIIPLDVINC